MLLMLTTGVILVVYVLLDMYTCSLQVIDWLIIYVLKLE